MMQISIVHLSDIHFRANGNPVVERAEAMIAAISSLKPKADGCLVLTTGDVAFSGLREEYDQAISFFVTLRRHLELLFGTTNVHFDFVQGNHDCLQPNSNLHVREALVNGAQEYVLNNKPDLGYVDALLAPQLDFFDFFERFMGRTIEKQDRIRRSETVQLSGKAINLILLNTALLSQRDEQVGTLALPISLLDDLLGSGANSDLSICAYHHPDNWLEPNLRRQFLKFVESTSNLVFTGHEHQQDNHWTESSTGDQTAFIEADALQDKSYPRTSGFNCLVVDFEDGTQIYTHFRWKKTRYSPVVDGQVHKIQISRKSQDRFEITDTFRHQLGQDDFGFTHKNHPDLSLCDFFVYPPISLSEPGSTKNRQVPGEQIVTELLRQRCVYLHGSERAGKSSLLKTLYLDISKATSRIPLLLSGSTLTGKTENLFRVTLRSAIRVQYGSDAVELFEQLPSARKIIMIDDFQNSRVAAQSRKKLIETFKGEADLVIVASSDFPDVSDYGVATPENAQSNLFTVIMTMRELPPSARAAIVRKWLKLGHEVTESNAKFIRDVEREQNVLNDLIGRKALPSLPYLIVGVLQIRQHSQSETTDPGSFGFLFQTLVTDALSVTTGSKPHIDRKDGILKRFAYILYHASSEVGSKEDFLSAARMYSTEIGIRVDPEAIFLELLTAKVLKEVDGSVTFRHPHFYHYFLAKHLLDIVDSDDAARARAELNNMADRPLVRSNQLTLIFFLFFKSKDPIIDRLIQHANETFKAEPTSDLVSDVRFIDEGLHVLTQAQIDEDVDVTKQTTLRLAHEDKKEIAANGAVETPLEVEYSPNLPFLVQNRFAQARMELLGQIIRGFSGTLDRKKKVAILESVFRLGLRNLHATLQMLSTFATAFSGGFEQIENKEQRATVQKLAKDFIALFARIHCDSTILSISRAVGVSDIEDAYEEAILKVGESCATQLVELAIKLDHSEGFPMNQFQKVNQKVSKESDLATAVLSDLVQRHTQIFPLQRETLRKIAGVLRVSPVKLIENSGTTLK